MSDHDSKFKFESAYLRDLLADYEEAQNTLFNAVKDQFPCDSEWTYLWRGKYPQVVRIVWAHFGKWVGFLVVQNVKTGGKYDVWFSDLQKGER